MTLMARPTGSRSLSRLALAYGASLLLMSVAFPFYRLVGYNLYTVGVLLALVGACGYVALRSEGLTLTDVGAAPVQLLRALGVLACTYGIFLALLAALQAVDLVAAGPLFKPVKPAAIVDNWLLTGFFEELLFRGFILLALIRLLGDHRFPWRSVIIGALLFSLFHLPTAIGYSAGMNLVMDLAIPFASALLVFGPLYLASRNLWLAAFVHGVTNYPIVPQIKENPLLGLVFMGLAILLGRYLLRSPTPLPTGQTQ